MPIFQITKEEILHRTYQVCTPDQNVKNYLDGELSDVYMVEYELVSSKFLHYTKIGEDPEVVVTPLTDEQLEELTKYGGYPTNT